MRRGVPQGSALSPTFFNVHINDLFYHIKQANLNAYADDEQLYSSDKDLELNTRLEHELGIGNSWYERNDMIVNPDKHQAMVLGVNSNYEFSFPVKNSVDLLDVTIDKDFSFNSHISQICVTVYKQFRVLKSWFKNIRITSNFMLRVLHIALLFGIFLALEIVINSESLKKRSLRFMFNDSLSSYDELLKKAMIASL